MAQINSKIYHSIGLMSGTSLDGVDVALIETDGVGEVKSIANATYPYDEAFRQQMKACFGNRLGLLDEVVVEAERSTTDYHIRAVKSFLSAHQIAKETIDIIGFHGQTIWHNPAMRETIQIGDGPRLAAETGIDVVYDMRKADVLAGGQGAPLLPLYHRALASKLEKPVAILNIGGISNVTWINGEGDDEILAFDCGPGNALINDWVLRHTGQAFDEDGKLALQGKVDEAHIAAFLEDPYFKLGAKPKSLDRDNFMKYMPNHLSPADGAATLTAMTVQAIALGLQQIQEIRHPRVGGGPIFLKQIYLCGGGMHNKTMRLWLAEATGAKVGTVEELGWNGDALEAEGWAYLAVRSLLGLPLTLPGTTGCPHPMPGGKLAKKQP